MDPSARARGDAYEAARAIPGCQSALDLLHRRTFMYVSTGPAVSWTPSSHRTPLGIYVKVQHSLKPAIHFILECASRLPLPRAVPLSYPSHPRLTVPTCPCVSAPRPQWR